MNREEIEQCIPDRHPFLWVDEVVEIGEGRIHARKKVDPELDVFKGHYPHFPVLPGVEEKQVNFRLQENELP